MCKDNSKRYCNRIWNKIYLTATALLLSVLSLLYTSKDIPSILSYPFCIYETKSHKTAQSSPRPILQCNYRGSTALFLSFMSFYYIYTPLFAIKYTYMLPETLCTSPTSAHMCIHREHDDSQRDLENFARLANCRGPSQKGDSVCVLTLPESVP